MTKIMTTKFLITESLVIHSSTLAVKHFMYHIEVFIIKWLINYFHFLLLSRVNSQVQIMIKDSRFSFSNFSFFSLLSFLVLELQYLKNQHCSWHEITPSNMPMAPCRMALRKWHHVNSKKSMAPTWLSFRFLFSLVRKRGEQQTLCFHRITLIRLQDW